MTHREIRVEALPRVEGEGAMHVEVTDGVLQDVQLSIYEPPRFFEALLVGREFTEPPDITARICGICPVAYQMSACQAIEQACGVSVDGQLRALRRLLYCGEWVESHTLHIYLLHAPDFLGFPDALQMGAQHRGALERGLELKRIGNRIVEVVGGRAVHPINVAVGGFFRLPTTAELTDLRAELLMARGLAAETVHWVSGFDFPELDVDLEMVALSHDEEYAIDVGNVASTAGRRLEVAGFGDLTEEFQVPYSTAKHARLSGTTPYLVGPLARWTLNSDRITGLTADVAREVGQAPTCRNPFRSIVVRALEVLYAVDEAIRLIDAYTAPAQPRLHVVPQAGTGHGATEAPRGLLYHRYSLDQDGLITAAEIIPPTSQNQPAIEHDLWRVVESNLQLPDDELQQIAETTIRNYDPCISCATHFLDMTVTRR
jgi:coenzyme F420-reducing hydrogenase alpha subunit